MAKRFFYVAIGILALTLAYHLGATKTEAQGSAAEVTTFTGMHWDHDNLRVWGVTSAGEIWGYHTNTGETNYIGAFEVGPVTTERGSWGSIKGKFK